MFVADWLDLVLNCTVVSNCVLGQAAMTLSFHGLKMSNVQ